MAMSPGVFSAWPWERLGSFKYLLYLPLVADAIHKNFLGGEDVENFSFHILVITSLRYLQGQLWMSITRFHDLVSKHRVQERSMKFEQLDREKNWEDFILFQALFLYTYHALNFMQIHPFWEWRGFVFTVFWHLGPVELAYYWFHRALHHHYLFRRYHSHHHSSFLTEAVTGNVHPFAEHFAYAWLFGSTYIVNSLLGTSSIALLYAYTLWFDFMNYIGHCNWEFFPSWLFRAVPGLQYFLYTPSYHSLHHTQVHTNFCLFMPIYDYLYGTVDRSSDEVYHAARRGRAEKVDLVFLTHPTDFLSVFHFSFGLPSFAAQPYEKKWFIYLLYPLAFPVMIYMWKFGKHFTLDEYIVEKMTIQVWAIPRFNFHYSLETEKASINKLIERAILSAREKGAKVICLGMHNKDESLNASGALCVRNISDSKISVVDGSSLTCSVVVNKIPKDVKEAFLLGAELKIGRAIATYLSVRRGVTVKMLIEEDSFDDLKCSIPEEHQNKLMRVKSLNDARSCTTWIVGQPLKLCEQSIAPAGTSFYQFTEEFIEEVRSDCSYSKLPAMHLPRDFKGLRSCEGKLPRGVIQASHAAGIVAAMEEWRRHEVGKAIDVELIDTVAKAAEVHGFVPYY